MLWPPVAKNSYDNKHTVSTIFYLAIDDWWVTKVNQYDQISKKRINKLKIVPVTYSSAAVTYSRIRRMQWEWMERLLEMLQSPLTVVHFYIKEHSSRVYKRTIRTTIQLKNYSEYSRVGVRGKEYEVCRKKATGTVPLFFLLSALPG